MLKSLYKRRILIIVVVILCALLGSALRYVVAINKQTMVLSLNYSGIDKGLNPDGSRYNVFEIRSNAVLDNTIKKANLQGFTVDYLRNRISIFSKMSANATEKVKTANESGSEYSYIPNEYYVSYSQKSKLTTNYTTEVLDALAKSYKEYFIKKYTEKNTVLKVDAMNYPNYEYLEIADLYANKITSMVQYLQNHNNENGTYRATKTNETFSNLITMLTNLNDIDVEKYRTYVTESALVKSKENYLNKLQYTVNSLELDYQKAIQSSNFTSDVMQKYDPSITGIMYIPSIDANNQYYMNRTQTGLDYLTKDAYKEAKQAEMIRASIDHYQYLITAFSASPDLTQQVSGEQTADQMLADIHNKLETISQLSLKTDEQYLEYKTRDYLKFDMPQTSISSFFNINSFIRYGIIGLCIAVAYVLLEYFFMRLRKYSKDNRLIGKMKRLKNESEE